MGNDVRTDDERDCTRRKGGVDERTSRLGERRESGEYDGDGEKVEGENRNAGKKIGTSEKRDGRNEKGKRGEGDEIEKQREGKCSVTREVGVGGENVRENGRRGEKIIQGNRGSEARRREGEIGKSAQD